MKTSRIVSIAIATAMALMLVACGSQESSSLSQMTLDEADGVKVIAENATADNECFTEGALTVEEGDVIVISPFLSQGSLHVTITSTDGKTTAYDDDADGQVLFTVAAEPGTYNVKTSGGAHGKAVGEMTIFSQSGEELAEQDAALADELEKNGVELPNKEKQ